MTFESSSISKGPKRVIAITGIAAVAVSLAFAVPQFQSQREIRRQETINTQMAHRGIPLAQPEAVEAFRSEMLKVFTNLHEITTVYKPRSSEQDAPEIARALSAAENGLEMMYGMSDAEMTLMMDVMPDLTSLVNSSNHLASIARTQHASAAASGNSVGWQPTGSLASSPGFPNAPYSSELGSVRPTTAAVLTSSGVFEAADVVRETASRGCDQVVVAIGAGGNGSAVCIVVDIVWAAAKGAFWAIQNTTDDVDSAEILGTYNRVGHLHTDISTLQTSIDAHDTNIDGDLAAHNANIDADLVAHNANIDADLIAHNANIDGDLIAHNANIDADLVAHDLNIDTDLANHNAAVLAALGNVQGTLDDEIEQRKVILQVIQILDRKRYLVICRESGKSVNVVFESVEIFNHHANSYVPLPAAETINVDPGTYHLQLNIPNLVPGDIFRVKVRHRDTVDHFGEIVFHRNVGV